MPAETDIGMSLRRCLGNVQSALINICGEMFCEQ